jgi:hypothetical protein
MVSYQLPGLPGVYHDLMYSIKPTPTALTPPTRLSSGDNSSDLSTLSGSLRPGPALPGTGNGTRQTPTPGRNIFVRNMEPDAALQAMIPAHLQLRTDIKNDPEMIQICPCVCPFTSTEAAGRSASALMTITVLYPHESINVWSALSLHN